MLFLYFYIGLIFGGAIYSEGLYKESLFCQYFDGLYTKEAYIRSFTETFASHTLNYIKDLLKRINTTPFLY